VWLETALNDFLGRLSQALFYQMQFVLGDIRHDAVARPAIVPSEAFDNIVLLRPRRSQREDAITKLVNRMKG